MNQPTHIKFDLLSNARDSLRQAIELLAWKDIRSDHARLKHSITNAAHAIELLLKERLRQIEPALIWENVNKSPNHKAHTVNVDTAISRLKKAGVAFSKEDEDILLSLRSTRNAIEHNEWCTTEKEAKVIVGNALSFAFSFAADQLDTDLAADFKQDDTWRSLIEEMYDFDRAHGARLEAKLREQGEFPSCCDACGELTIPMLGGSCVLCGHWQDVDDAKFVDQT